VLEIVAAGMKFVARWEEELAPRTVEAFRGILPFEDRIIHCRWSGESNWIPWGDREGRARPSCCSRTATAASPARPATSGRTISPPSSRDRSS
jgi:hypothetical protein